MQILENASPLSGVGRKIEDPNLLTRRDAPTWALCNFVGQSNFTGAEENQTPLKGPLLRPLD